MKWKTLQLLIITLLIIFQIQVYFVCSFFRKKVQRNASYKLNRSNLKKPKGCYTKLIFLCRNNACLKEDNSKSLTQGPQIVLNKCYRNI